MIGVNKDRFNTVGCTDGNSRRYGNPFAHAAFVTAAPAVGRLLVVKAVEWKILGNYSRKPEFAPKPKLGLKNCQSTSPSIPCGRYAFSSA